VNGFIGAFIEAWAEFRVHKARVILSLIGVAIAVLALTAVVGIGQIATQAQIEQLERGSGRPATLVVSPPYNPETGQAVDGARFDAAMREIADRYGIDFMGRTSWDSTRIQLPNGVQPLELTLVEPAYGPMHRVELVAGSWFTDRDEERLMPALIINEHLWEALGRPPMSSHPTVTVLSERPTEAIVIGVVPSLQWEMGFRADMLVSAWERIRPTAIGYAPPTPSVELWVPLEIADQLTERIRAELTTALGGSLMIDVFRADYLAWGDIDPIEPIRVLLIGVAALILLLGALGLVNIALVTVRQRIREIGIRRAFGATAPRVFLAVMLESVVATVVAGFVGVVLAIILVQNEWALGIIAPDLTDIPPFPADAALLGFACAVGVGALAGLLPAIVAVRVRVIDAIRY